MRSSFLTLSAGNSFTSIGAFRQGRLVQTAVRPAGEPLDEAVALVLRELGESGRPRFAVGISVRPPAWEPMEAALAVRGIPFHRIGPEVPAGLKTRYEAAGLDRLMAARAAFSLYGPCVVVDAGTAVTVDLVGPGPEFLGGAIAPGARLMGEALGRRCALLPEGVGPGPLPELPPAATREAMQAGVTLGFAGLVDRLVEALRPLVGPEAACVATGGEAPLWREHSRLASFHEPWLIHAGLALVAGDLHP